MPPGARTPRSVVRFAHGRAETRADEVVTEEPLELRLVHEGEERSVAVTMRTPGFDQELALGFLYAEGAIRERADVLSLERWREGDAENPNVLRLGLKSGFDALRTLSRATFTSSACGVCGTGSIEGLALRAAPAVWTAPPLTPQLLGDLPGQLLARQEVFAATGGLHGAGLFGAGGQLLAVREDVGRHNAVDKLVGWALTRGLLPLSNHVLVVSGRAGFEIAQKAALAGIPVVCSVSAPSSLAVEVAESFDLTLLGFVREGRFNVYAGAERIALSVLARPP